MRGLSSKKLIVSAVLALFLILPFLRPAEAQEKLATESLTIQSNSGKTHEFVVELALTPAQRSQGLMNRAELPADRGMLFEFGEVREVSMWMRNTPLPLDMLFLAQDGTVSRIHENATPFSDDIISSRGPVKFVLEINGGLSATLGINAADKVVSKQIGNRK